MSVDARRADGGFTLVELLLALGLMAVLMVALVNLIDTSLEIWGRTESERELVEVGSAVVELMERDLAALEPGPRGDLVAELEAWDLDGDQVPLGVLPRLRLVKRASAEELRRMGAPPDRDLVEVVWAVLPNKEAAAGAGRSIGLLYRGERPHGKGERLSFFDEGFIDAAGRTPAGAMEFVGGGVLWLGFGFATQTSIVHDGWTFGDQLQDCSTSWDAWSKGRPDLGKSSWNEPGAGMPPVKDAPLLPRRIRIELEIERPDELVRRTRLAQALETKGSQMAVEDGGRLPEPGSMILVDEEWMEVLSVAGDRVAVRPRPARHPRAHPPRGRDRPLRPPARDRAAGAPAPGGLGPVSTRPSKDAQRRGGFTIIEVVLAMFILLIGMSSILGLLSFGAALSRTAQLRNQASYAVESIVADLEETMFPLVELEDGTIVVGGARGRDRPAGAGAARPPLLRPRRSGPRRGGPRRRARDLPRGRRGRLVEPGDHPHEPVPDDPPARGPLRGAAP